MSLSLVQSTENEERSNSSGSLNSPLDESEAALQLDQFLHSPVSVLTSVLPFYAMSNLLG